MSQIDRKSQKALFWRKKQKTKTGNYYSLFQSMKTQLKLLSII